MPSCASASHGSSILNNVRQQTLISAIPPVLVLNLKFFRYDGAAGSITKFGKSIRFEGDLEIPLDIMAAPMLNDTQSHRIASSIECSTITANLQAMGTTRSMFFTRTETATEGKFGCTQAETRMGHEA